MNEERRSILVADDEEGIRESLKLILEEDYEVALAVDGQEALQMTKDHQYDLIFLDLKMPKMDGIEVLREIRQTAPDLPVLVLTAYQSVEMAKEAVKLGAADYLTKPFDREGIQGVVNRIFVRS